MPNHVQNELIFRSFAPPLEKLVTKDGKVDFEILVPIPPQYWWGSVGSKEQNAFPGTALDWCTKNWGTKWNAYQSQPVIHHEGGFILRFQTAWAAPYGWFAAILNVCERPFSYTYFDEGAEHAREGRFWFTENWGPQWEEKQSDQSETDRLCKMMFGKTMAEMEAD